MIGLPFYLTPFSLLPIAHFVSMGSLYAAMDQIVEQVAVQFLILIGFYTPHRRLLLTSSVHV